MEREIAARQQQERQQEEQQEEQRERQCLWELQLRVRQQAWWQVLRLLLLPMMPIHPTCSS